MECVERSHAGQNPLQPPTETESLMCSMLPPKTLFVFPFFPVPAPLLTTRV